MRVLGWGDVRELASNLRNAIRADHPKGTLNVYAVPRGGLFAALLLGDSIQIVSDPEQAHVIVDDVYDSGRTTARYKARFGLRPWYYLVDKRKPEWAGQWVVFPWETQNEQSGPEENVRRLLQFIGENPDREGLLDTPKRVVKAWKEMFSGYQIDPESVLTVFEDGACDEMVLLKDIEFNSHCVVGSTFVETPRGRIPIQYLEDGDWVYSYDESQSTFDVTRCYNPRVTRKQADLVMVYTDKDSLLCTPDHKILTYERGWIEAQDLRKGERAVALNKGLIECPNNRFRPYLQLNDLSGQKQVPEHRFVYERINNCILGKEHVHHIDGDESNNDPSNLTSMSHSAHIRLHRLAEDKTGFARMTDTERWAMEAKRKARLAEVHNDPEKRQKMLKKRSESVRAHWAGLNHEQYKNRIRNMGNHKVIAVRSVPWREDVWCMNVDKNRNFVANGMVVHNCEHHLLPFMGKAHVAYVPNGRVIGVSKLARILDIFSKRLQIQERLSQQVTDALDTHLKPQGSACIIEASHMCMVCRGVRKQHSVMVTSSLTGIFKKDTAARHELLSLIRS